MWRAVYTVHLEQASKHALEVHHTGHPLGSKKARANVDHINIEMFII